MYEDSTLIRNHGLHNKEDTAQQRDNGNDDVSLKPRRTTSTKARYIVAMVTLNGVISYKDETHGTVTQRRLLVIG